MKKTIKRMRTPGGSIKRAISLPKDLDERVKALAQKDHESYSAVVGEAVAHYLKRREDQETEAAYRQYYAGVSKP